MFFLLCCSIIYFFVGLFFFFSKKKWRQVKYLLKFMLIFRFTVQFICRMLFFFGENIVFWFKIFDFKSQKNTCLSEFKFVNVMISKYLQQSTKLGFQIKYSILCIYLLHSIKYMRWGGGGAGIIRKVLVDTQHSVLAFF